MRSVFANRNGNVSSPLLKEKAYQEIREAILNETFKPGEFLSEKRLIDWLGMSKTPIKSALDRLEAEGFVAVSPKQGILVKELSLTKASDIFDLRIALEVFVCELIAGNLKPDHRLEIERNMEEQRRCADIGDEVGFTLADAEFHLLLCKFSGNEEIYQLMLNYQALLYRLALRVLQRVPNRMDVSFRDHVEIWKALVEGNAAQSSARIREHLIFGKSTLTS